MKNESSYYIHQNGVQKGPWTLAEIVRKIDSQEIQAVDYIFDESKKDWVMMLEFQHLASRWNQAPPQAQTQKSPRPNSAEEWFVLRGDNKYGPFVYLDLVKMLQEKTLQEFDFIWNVTMQGWTRVSETAEFQADKIKALREKGEAKESAIFFRRKHARTKVTTSILLHNNKEVWKGQSLELSAGGAGLVIDSDQIEVGQNLFLHLKAGDGVPPFNAVCEIVSKQILDGHHGKVAVRYGVRFTKISQTVQQAIKKITDQAA
ncbi:MAG: hypothetical protein COT73_05605 [Bdellovibrio sp. CG10_big_fil_rev_8_21_14_0_10_47_8]|nr:MAG: hypothetical protein COT73_05605 [Bdellovibrio sp. CG10_big_fil_rev_8_21_14_0_10_47_8]